MRSPLSIRRRGLYRPLLERCEDRVVPGFLAPLAFYAGGNPQSVAVGDLNGDGIADLAVANNTSSVVSVLLGNGDGSFQQARQFRTASGSSFVAVGDLNSDGLLDLAVANGQSSSVSVLLGNGDGSFQNPLNLPAGSNQQFVAIGDMDSNGLLDLAVASDTSPTGTIRVFLGNGDGTFQSARTFDTGIRPSSVAIADVNVDGLLDLAVVNQGSANVSLFLGNGDGSFQNAGNSAVGSLPFFVAVADVNGDGLPDLIVSNWGSNNVSVLLGNGDGSFQAARDFNAGSRPWSVAVGDVNGDGLLDLCVTNLDGRDVSVLLGYGDGTFQDAQNFYAGDSPYSVALADFNGDGLLDLAVANAVTSGTVVILLGSGDGTFSRAPHFPVGDQPRSIAVGDFNGDCLLDLAVGNNRSGDVSILLSNSDGSFQEALNFSTDDNPIAVEVGDFNGDGFLDLAVASSAAFGGTPSVSILLGNGDGSFQDASSFSAGSFPTFLAVADLNGDGLLDLVVTNEGIDPDPGDVRVLLGNGDGSFQPARIFRGNSPNSVAAVDLNNDGLVDLAVPNVESREVSVLLGNGDGTFQDAVNYPVSNFSRPIIVGDFNSDGALDLVTGSVILMGNGDGTFQDARVHGGGGSVAVDFNGDGFLDLTAAIVWIDLGNGIGSFTARLGRYAAGSGSSALAVGDFNQDGLPDLAVANSGSNDVTILVNDGIWPGAPAAYFWIYPDAGDIAVGAPLDLWVFALDARFELAWNYTGEVLFWSTDALATLPEPYRFRPEDWGAAYFAAGVRFATPGVQELYVFDTATFTVIGYAVFNVLGSGPGGGPAAPPPDLAAVAALLSPLPPPPARDNRAEGRAGVPPPARQVAATALPEARSAPVAAVPAGRAERATRELRDYLFADLGMVLPRDDWRW